MTGYKNEARTVRNFWVDDRDWKNLGDLAEHLTEQDGTRISIAHIIRMQIKKILRETGYDKEV